MGGRYMCPDCDGGGMLLLEDGLICSCCGGSYVWEKKGFVSTKSVTDLREEGQRLGIGKIIRNTNLSASDKVLEVMKVFKNAQDTLYGTKDLIKDFDKL